MVEYLMIEKKKKGNSTFYLLSNISNSIVLEESKLKGKLRNNEINVSNLVLNQNQLVLNSMYNAELTNEKELFYALLIDKISYCSFDYNIVYFMLNKLKKINRREIDFDSDKELRERIIDFLEKFFNYLGKTRYTFLKEKYNEMFVFKAGESKYIINQLQDEVSTYLVEYVNNGRLINWFQNREKDAYCYDIFLDILKEVWNEPFSDKRKKQISFILDLLNTFFEIIGFTSPCAFLYQNYLLSLSNICVESIETHTDISLPLLNEEKRKEILKKTAGYTEKEYKNRLENIQECGRKINRLVTNYGVNTYKILDCIGGNENITIKDKENLNSVIRASLIEILSLYREILVEIKKCGVQEKGTFELIENICELEDESKVALFKPLKFLASIKNVFDDLGTLLQKGVDSCLNDCLSSQSLTLFKHFQELSEGRKGTLYYIVDMIRLKSCKESKQGKLKLYSPIGIRPLLEINTLAYRFIFVKHDGITFNRMDRKYIDFAWLTAYYIMNDLVDYTIGFVRKNDSTISWAFFEKSFEVLSNQNNYTKYFHEYLQTPLTNKTIADLKDIKKFVKYTYKWNIDDNLKVNLYLILKKED